MKIYTVEFDDVGSVIVVANSAEEAKEIIRTNQDVCAGGWIQEYEIENGMAFVTGRKERVRRLRQIDYISCFSNFDELLKEKK